MGDIEIRPTGQLARHDYCSNAGPMNSPGTDCILDNVPYVRILGDTSLVLGGERIFFGIGMTGGLGIYGRMKDKDRARKRFLIGANGRLGYRFSKLFSIELEARLLAREKLVATEFDNYGIYDQTADDVNTLFFSWLVRIGRHLLRYYLIFYFVPNHPPITSRVAP